MKTITEKLKNYSFPKKITLVFIVWIIFGVIAGTLESLFNFSLIGFLPPVILTGPLLIYLIFFPVGYVWFDKNQKNEQKLGWTILVLFFSWLAFAFYLINKKD